MEFVNEFAVPTDIETTWKILLDLEQVAPCLPGAILDEVEGDVYTGRVKVKVGPVTVSYRGTAELVDVDRESRSARIAANGKETRGAGTASADVSAKLSEANDGTLVRVVTDLTVTGKPAQFGRGVMEDVGTKIIGQFAERLEALVLSGNIGGAAAGVSPDAPVGEPSTVSAAPTVERDGFANGAAPKAAGPRKITPDSLRADDALDLLDVAGSAALKRLMPIVAGVAAVAAFIWWITRR
jgi:uncharacterized protein